MENRQTTDILSNLLSLCDYLGCSAEFISGRGDAELGFSPKLPPPFSQAVRDMMCRKGITTYRLRKETRYGGSCFARWDRGPSPIYPRRQSLQIISAAR